MGKMKKAVSHSQDTPRSLAAAIIPAFGIKWNQEVINAVTRGEINRLLKKLKNPHHPRQYYDRLSDFFRMASLCA